MNSAYILFIIHTTAILVNGNVNKFTSANNLFTASIYKEIFKNNEGNFLVSPFSAETVLSLVQLGARGETAEELRSTLNLPKNQNEVVSAVKTLLPSLENKQLYSFHVANKVYLQENYPIKADFGKIATEVFRSAVENVDFSKNVQAANKMNKWVEEQTANNIHDLVDPDGIDSNSRAILINALYFQANWSKPFESFRTRYKKFYQNGNEEIYVTMMHDYHGPFNFYENLELDAKFLELPFVDESVTMTLVLPNELEGLPLLESHIDKVLQPQPYVKQGVGVAIPNFKIESKFDFKNILMNLGVTKAFVYGVADFGGISDEKLVINKVIQKTFVNVGEEGVEAAAATYADANFRIGHGSPDPNLKSFNANHPFLFYIKVKDLIIFTGRVTTLPSQY